MNNNLVHVADVLRAFASMGHKYVNHIDPPLRMRKHFMPRRAAENYSHRGTWGLQTAR